MIKCIAIDDEPLALELIKSFCKDIEYIDLQEVFTQTSKATQYIYKNDIDLIFLDVNMPDVNGFNFYKSLRNEPMVIFTTAYSQYAVEGFNVNAVDYLVKPINKERFVVACEKAKNISEKTFDQADFFLVRAEYAVVKIMFSDVLYIESSGDYVKIVRKNEKPLMSLMSMKKLTEQLPEDKMIRVHRSYFVALDKIEKVRAKNIYIADKVIPIGISYEAEVLKKIT
jgi:DNA-binding LytR/AlgR family response regulator